MEKVPYTNIGFCASSRDDTSFLIVFDMIPSFNSTHSFEFRRVLDEADRIMLNCLGCHCPWACYFAKRPLAVSLSPSLKNLKTLLSSSFPSDYPPLNSAQIHEVVTICFHAFCPSWPSHCGSSGLLRGILASPCSSPSVTSVSHLHQARPIQELPGLPTTCGQD